MKTIEVYLQAGRYNPVCDAVTEYGEVPICRPWEAVDARQQYERRV